MPFVKVTESQRCRSWCQLHQFSSYGETRILGHGGGFDVLELGSQNFWKRLFWGLGVMNVFSLGSFGQIGNSGGQTRWPNQEEDMKISRENTYIKL